MSITFDILDWQAWFPAQQDAQPDVSVIPAMLRRRLSPLARAAMSVIMPLATTHGAMPLVYVSRHGDLSRTVDILRDLANNELLSPTAFSLSVHNATAGLFSIQQGLTKNITAISGGTQELVPALLESRGLCTAIEPKVLCVFCDEPPPSLYQAQACHPQMPYAFALVIGCGESWELSQAGATVGDVPQDAPPQVWQLFELLQEKRAQLALACNGSDWTLAKCE